MQKPDFIFQALPVHALHASRYLAERYKTNDLSLCLIFQHRVFRLEGPAIFPVALSHILSHLPDGTRALLQLLGRACVRLLKEVA
jgi:hypothetical protein